MPTFEDDEDDDDSSPVERPPAKPARRELPPMPPPEDMDPQPRPITPPFQGGDEDVAGMFDAASAAARGDDVAAERFRQHRVTGGVPGSVGGRVLPFRRPGQAQSQPRRQSATQVGDAPAAPEAPAAPPAAPPEAAAPPPAEAASEADAPPWWIDWGPVIVGGLLLAFGWWFSGRQQKAIGDLADEYDDGDEDEEAA